MPAIISASRRTDIPAYYSEWFMGRMREGRCRVMNPFSRQWSEVDLTPEAVAGIVFWSKDIGPLIPHLSEVRANYPFYVQLTITGHARELEPHVPEAEAAVAQAWEISGRFGREALVWRFDPIVHTQHGGPEDTLRRFESLADRLAGATGHCIISFMSPYRRQKRAFAAAGLEWNDPDEAQRLVLAEELRRAGEERGISLAACCNPDLAAVRVEQARCVDAERLRVLGAALPDSVRAAASRPGCGCCKSTDIGAYDTCPAGCAYCYANSNYRLARANYARHRTEHEGLAEAHSVTDG